ncbi:MAG: hypothetical protein JW774_00685, partial [Candidatus Aureabacteria bacterium]|nr:hypothetical protein [Candidatus Auribacterota bacterium]
MGTIEQLSEKLSAIPSLDGTLMPILCEKGRIIVLWDAVQFKIILVWSQIPFALESGLSRQDFPENTRIFSPEDFDTWLLSDVELLDQVVKNADFLQKWIPHLNPESPLGPRQLLSYLFSIGRPQRHYNLASVLGEDKFFSGITENDQEFRFLHLPLLHFTLSKKHVLYFCKIRDEKILENLPNLLEKYWADPSERAQFIQTFKTTLQSIQNTSFNEETFFNELKKILDKASQKYDFSNINPEIKQPLIRNIIIFFQSNGIAGFNDFRNAEDWFKKEVSEQFLMAKTTAFFRDWREMKFLYSWLIHLDKQCSQEKRPIKIKVFGCSTGQEALSYAFELLDLGINHFTILASDIDANVLAEAEQMAYSADKFQTMPLMKK